MGSYPPTSDDLNNKKLTHSDWINEAYRVRNIDSLVYESYDYIGVTYPDTTSEVYVFKTGGSSGTLVATVTVVYTDSTKANLTSVTRS